MCLAPSSTSRYPVYTLTCTCNLSQRENHSSVCAWVGVLDRGVAKVSLLDPHPVIGVLRVRQRDIAMRVRDGRQVEIRRVGKQVGCVDDREGVSVEC
jgi:hypothetical protein